VYQQDKLDTLDFIKQICDGKYLFGQVSFHGRILNMLSGNFMHIGLHTTQQSFSNVVWQHLWGGNFKPVYQ